MTLIAHSGLASIDLTGSSWRETFLASDEDYTKETDRWDSLPLRLRSGRFPNLSPSLLLSGHQRDLQSGLLLPKGFQRPSPSPPDGTWIVPNLPSGWASSQALSYNPFTTTVPNWTLRRMGPTSWTYGPYGNPITTEPVQMDVEQREMPVIGFRGWNFSRQFKLGLGTSVHLGSTGVRHHWKPGVQKAVHEGYEADPTHRAPEQHCSCGFYVLRDVDTVSTHNALGDNLVVGAVMGWGKVVQHGEEGWRAEYVRLLALMDCKLSKRQSKNTQEAARAYGVEVKSRSALEALVREYGDPLPSSEDA